MKKFILLALVSVLFVACGTQKSAQPNDLSSDRIQSKQEFATPAVTTQKNATSVSVGGICGGPEKLTCDRGNICAFDDQDSEGKGICDALIIDDAKECPDTQAPVCGLRKGQKHGFLNKCYLEKHGAEFVSNGLCKKEDIAGQCGAQAVGVGTCFKTIKAYVFDGKNCQKKYITGCDAEIPFETIKACEKACK